MAVSSWREERYSGTSPLPESLARASQSGAQSEPGEAKIFSTPRRRSVRSKASAPVIPSMIFFPVIGAFGSRSTLMFSRTCGLASDRGARRKHQRFDYDRHGARGLEQRADVDEVEFLEDDPVDRHDWIGQLHLLAVDADQAAHVTVSDEDERQAAAKLIRKAGDDSPAEGVQPPKRRRALPTVAKGDHPLAVVQIEPAQGESD